MNCTLFDRPMNIQRPSGSKITNTKRASRKLGCLFINNDAFVSYRPNNTSYYCTLRVKSEAIINGGQRDLMRIGMDIAEPKGMRILAH